MSQGTQRLVGLEESMYGSWKPSYRLAGTGFSVLVGAFLWLHANYSPGSYGEFSGLYELAGASMCLFGFSGFVVWYLFPFSSRKAVNSPVIIGVDCNRLMAIGDGKFSGITRQMTLNKGDFYSTDTHLIADPEKLTAAINSLLLSLKVRVKPFVVIMPFQNGRGYSPTPAERKLLLESAVDAQALDVALVTPDSEICPAVYGALQHRFEHLYVEAEGGQ